MKGLIVLNFKLYKEASGNKALELAKKIEKVKHNGYEIVVVPSLLTMKEVKDKTKLTVFSQHTGHVPLGAHTGRVSAKELKLIGIKGTLLNHSERKIPLKYLVEIIANCKKEKLRTIVCASSLGEVKKIAAMKPDYIAYEPKELIGGNVSVTEANPDVIVKAVDMVRSISKKTKVLCGAGVHNKEDVGHSLMLGCAGVLIGHAVPKAKDPIKFLQEMLL